MATFESPLASPVPAYAGTVSAKIYEVAPEMVTNLIRSDQEWGAKVEWEVHGPLAIWLDAEFRLNLFLESMGPGVEYVFPQPPEPSVTVSTLAGTLTIDPVNGPTRTYTKEIPIKKGDAKPGTYKAVMTIQLYETTSGNPVPFASFVELPYVNIYQV